MGRTVRVSLAIGALAIALAAGLLSRGAPLEARGAGTFDCGHGLHGCIAWLVVRPSSWTMPAGWAPGRNDGQFPAIGDPSGKWTVDGAVREAPSRLPQGEYTFHVVVSEVDDTKPFVLGTDTEPTTGLIGTTTMCSATSVVTSATTVVRLVATFGPTCAVDVEAIE